MFHYQMKHLEVPQKYSAARRICNFLLGVLVMKHGVSCLTIERNQPSESDSWFHASFEHCDDILMVDRGRGHSKIVIDLLNIIGK